MSHNRPFRIDIDRVLRDKAPGSTTSSPVLYQLVEANRSPGRDGDILDRNQGLEGVEFMRTLVDEEFKVTLHAEGEENIPETGRFIFASNHPLGGLDGICLSAFLGEKFNGKIKYLVNDVLYYIEPLKPIFVPINKYGAQGKASVKAINEAYASDNQIITFPAGLCSRKRNGVITDLDWLKNFIVKAVEFQRDVILMHFEVGTPPFLQPCQLAQGIGLKFAVSWSTFRTRCSRIAGVPSPSRSANHLANVR